MNSQMNKLNQLSAFADREIDQGHPLKNNSKYTSQFQSPYITKGVYTHSIKYDPSISFETLETVQVAGNSVVIGRGALSVVYLAKDTLKSINYAIKEMKKEVLMERLGSLEPVYNEIDIHSRLIHKNIIKVHNVYEDNDSIKIILEHASQGSLHTYIKRSKGLTEKKAFDFFIQAASAIHFLHLNNIIHRDLKPENFIIGDKDDLKLCDFGWSNRIFSSTRDTICGTVEYMAPEIVNRQQYDKAIDIWSLGILLYELIHKHSPFNTNKIDNNNPYEIMAKIKNDNVLFEKDISRDCQDIIKRMLEKDQKKRITIDEIFKHPFVTNYENGIKNRHQSTWSDVSTIRRQMTTNVDSLTHFKANLNKIQGDHSNKMKQIAAILLSDTIDTDESSNANSKNIEKGKADNNKSILDQNTQSHVKPRNKLSFKMEMKTRITTSRNSPMNSMSKSNEDSNDSKETKETTITPVKTMSVKCTNIWFSQLKKPIGPVCLFKDEKKCNGI